MIVVDTSALIAIVLGEADASRYARILASAQSVKLGAPTLLEARQVAQGKAGPGGVASLAKLIEALRIEVLDWTATHADLAFDAFLTFGKGRHPAALNFGDCMAYALARSLDAPLLFKGEDFARTDVRAAA